MNRLIDSSFHGEKITLQLEDINNDYVTALAQKSAAPAIIIAQWSHKSGVYELFIRVLLDEEEVEPKAYHFGKCFLDTEKKPIEFEFTGLREASIHIVYKYA